MPPILLRLLLTSLVSLGALAQNAPAQCSGCSLDVDPALPFTANLQQCAISITFNATDMGSGVCPVGCTQASWCQIRPTVHADGGICNVVQAMKTVQRSHPIKCDGSQDGTAVSWLIGEVESFGTNDATLRFGQLKPACGNRSSIRATVWFECDCPVSILNGVEESPWLQIDCTKCCEAGQ